MTTFESGTASGHGADFPPPPAEILQLWHDFPVAQEPRPIVFLDSPVHLGDLGFVDGAAKRFVTGTRRENLVSWVGTKRIRSTLEALTAPATAGPRPCSQPGQGGWVRLVFYDYPASEATALARLLLLPDPELVFSLDDGLAYEGASRPASNQGLS